MTYQALARKWRPRTFADVVGQAHAVAALTHALDNDRVHHAFLFTGTRGVGKTTLARLLARSLNCEKGVSSTPCGECGACVSVDQGRFVDLLEIDAASRTRVDDTREILDNVQYAPTMGRFKVYLVDEVHMLSTHSFNALLKTLEEPPPHVKFVLATTDPQKLPATILSRCLQFNLRALDVDEIAGQLARILEQEGIDSEPAARELVARAADGSMRDALSLLDQAIAFSGARLDAASVRRMLGMIEGSQVVEIVEALVDGDASRVFGVVDTMRQRSINFTRALDDILILLHEIALAIEAPDLAAERDSPWRGQLDVAGRMSAEQVQLLYQIALIGKRDLPLAPDPARGFEMVMLRMLAFEPDRHPAGEEVENLTSPSRPAGARAGARPASTGKPAALASVSKLAARRSADSAPQARAQRDSSSEPAAEPAAARTPGQLIDSNAWQQFAENAPLHGLARELAMNLEFIGSDEHAIQMRLKEALSHLLNANRQRTLEAAIAEAFGPGIRLAVDVSAAADDDGTPAAARQRRLKAEREAAAEGLVNDPDISTFINQFDAELVPDSVLPGTQRGK